MKLSLFTTALLASGIASAAVPIDGWYASVFGGYTYLPSNINSYNAGAYISDAAYGNGYNAGLRIGFQSNPIRYEAEYTYLHATSNKFYVNRIRQSGVTGNLAGNLIMANLYYDAPEILSAGIVPFLGLGIGYAFIQTNLQGSGPVGTTILRVDSNSFAYQGTAGLTYNFSENYALNIAYRYTAASSSNHLGKTFQAQMASVGAIYRFDETCYK